MGGQFHDILPGTATPKAFQFSWNDDVIAMNQFAGVLTSATEGIASALDTQTVGTPIVVYNPLNIEREDVVQVNVPFKPNTRVIRVIGPDGREVPSQNLGTDADDGMTAILFVAKVPSVGYAVYDVQEAEPVKKESRLKVSESLLENERYRIRLNSEGNVGEYLR